jgi:hypothetical protein
MRWGLSLTTLTQLSRAFWLKERGASHPLQRLQRRALIPSLPAVHSEDQDQTLSSSTAGRQPGRRGGAHCVPRGGSSSSASSPSFATDCQPSSMMRNPGGAPAACRLHHSRTPTSQATTQAAARGGGGPLLPWGGKG